VRKSQRLPERIRRMVLHSLVQSAVKRRRSILMIHVRADQDSSTRTATVRRFMATKVDEILGTLALSEEKAAGVSQLRNDLKYGGKELPWKTDCFLVAWLQEELSAAGLFDEAVLAALGSDIAGRMPFLKKMLTHDADYQRFVQKASPYLFFTGDDICYGTLEDFILSFGEAFERAGYRVIFQNRWKIPEDYAKRFNGRSYRAVFGMQDPLFSQKFDDGSYLLGKISAPFYFFSFDHPAGFYQTIINSPEDLTVLALDRYYADYVRNYMHRKAVFFPPGGRRPEEVPLTFEEFKEKKLKENNFELSFVGSAGKMWSDYSDTFLQMDPVLYRIAKAFENRMIAETDKPSEQVFLETAEAEHLIELISNRDNFAKSFAEWVILEKSVAQKFRQLIIKELAGTGPEIHLYGDDWNIPGAKAHSKLPYDKIRDVYRSSWLSLNVMTWHKAGFTERIVEPQLQGSLVVTDSTEYLKETYTDGEDIILYDLSKESISELGSRLKAVLSDKDRLLHMAWNGYRKAMKYHTWDARVEQFLKMTV
jgi:hypothetical protein